MLKLTSITAPSALLAALALASAPAFAQERYHGRQNPAGQQSSGQSRERAQPRSEAPREQPGAARVEPRQEAPRAQPPQQQQAQQQPQRQAQQQPQRQVERQPQRQAEQPRVDNRSRTKSGLSRIRRMSSMPGRYTASQSSKQKKKNFHLKNPFAIWAWNPVWVSKGRK